MAVSPAQGKAALSWPSVAGVVTASSIDTYKTKGGPQFMAKVSYDYAVDGVSYSGNRLRFGYYAAAHAKAGEDVAKNKVAHRSVLEPGTTGISVLGLVLAITGGLFLVVVGIVAAID